MKHRSIHIFILVAALLVVAPQASQELSDVKDAIGRRLKSEIFHAFLSLQTGEGARLSPQAAGGLFAPGAGAEVAAGDKRTGARQARAASPQVEVHARREVPAEVEPVVEVAAVTEAAPRPAPDFKFELHDTKVMRGRELAIIIPPDADFTAPPPPPAQLAKAEAVRRAAPRVRRAAELERRAAAFQVNLDLGAALEAGGFADAEVRRQLEGVREFRLDPEGVRVLTKTLKVKRAAPKPPPAPPARTACPRESAKAASPQVACGPAEAQSFYVTE